MKRGKDDEKIMGPMFPRLHVNDREKGGPRAPPRNKMALYEQLSIPSQRFSPGDVPIKSNSNSNLDPSGSSSQRGGLERNFHFPHRIPPPTSSQPAEPLQPDRQDISASVPHVEKRKKAGDEDDFTVPIFVHSGMGQDHNKIQNVDRENPTLRAAHSGNSKFHDHCDNASKVVRSPCTNNLNEENVGVSMSSAILPTRRKIARTTAETIASRNQDCDDNSVVDLSLFCENDVCLQQEPDTGLQLNADCHDDSISGTDLTREREKGNSLLQRSNSCSREVTSRSRGPEIDLECHGDKTSGLLQLRNGDKSNGISETSMLDSVSAMAISPDDVVGIIGQKHFWKARRAIVNQQRVFAVQVFELHRLIKVQQLMAESPHLLLEDSTYLTAPALMDSPPRKLPSENVTDVPRHVDKRKDDSDKSNHNMESSAENAVGRTSISLVKSSSQPANHGPYLGNPTPVPVAADPKMTPWYFPQPQPQPQPFGHQWLVPVMSPTEGLVYKPYTSPGYMESACGGCGPVPPSPMNCNHVNPAYGVPGTHHYHHHHHQGFGIMPGTPPVGHGYYPPYGMPVMNPAMSGSAVDQMNGFVGSGSNGQSGELPGATSSMQHQSSCNIPAQNNGTMQVTNLQSKDTELQGSTASSPGEKAGTGMVQDSNGIDALSLFPVAPATPEGDLELQEAELPTRVIRVVPHNGRSATASAARIFQSIQEERRNVDAI